MLCPYAVVARAAGLAEDAQSSNFKRAYRSEQANSERCYAAQGFVSLAATPVTVEAYLADHETRLSFATLTRRLSAIAVVHKIARFVLDSRHPEIADVMKGPRSELGNAQRQA